MKNRYFLRGLQGDLFIFHTSSADNVGPLCLVLAPPFLASWWSFKCAKFSVGWTAEAERASEGNVHSESARSSWLGLL